ncbi:hypothetical protein AOC05_04980 [Arthrobacter alpinus]|uniref:Scaffolding protein n=1 Tax=Arthrobacter alpinus TaxID=656366 RepID=A0A0M4QXG8_9MICC|nr:hypothetical protein [Arthrobacter alpinus]ALE91827.1 hypothetical protein AOC05_04980 [Arthrobacter alpinus]
MSKRTIHGIDITAPGGITALMDFHRLTFGDAVMEEGAGGPAPAGATPAAALAETPAPEGDKPLGENGEKALASERDARKVAEARVRELEDASKSDEQKRGERFAQLEKSDREKDSTIGSLESTIQRYQIAASKGLDLDAAERLRGSTKEEIEADADEWIAKWGTSKSPREVPGAGARGEDRNDVAPGLDRLRQAYTTPSK